MSKAEIKILMIDGRTLVVKKSLVLKTLIHRYSIMAIVGAFSILFALKPYEYIQNTPSWFAAPFLLTTVVIMLGLIAASLVFTGSRLGFDRIVTLPSSLISTVTMMFATDQFLALLAIDPLMPMFDFFVKCIFTLMFAEIVIFFYLNFIYPSVLKETFGDSVLDTADHSQVTDKYFDVSGAKIPATDVIYLEARQSYVNVVTASRTYLVRRKFSAFVAEMPERLGLQVHRSYWVKTDAVSELRRVNPHNFEIYLKNGVTIPVSRSRSSEVEKWFQNIQQ